MIFFHTETKFQIKNKRIIKQWLNQVIANENAKASTINFIFCDDNFLLSMNNAYLNHDTFTDIITFDYSSGRTVSGDVFISIERVKENAKKYSCSFYQELYRVLVHGVLHLLGYKDKSKIDQKVMRMKEDSYLSMIM